MECLVDATTQENSLTICADPNQQILSFIDSSGLENFQINLTKSGVNSETLQVSYRSTKEIMEVANNVLDLGPGEGSRQGEPVFFGKYNDKDDALLELEQLVQQHQEKTCMVFVVQIIN